MHALKKSNNGYNGFGEVYFSWVEHAAIKAWKFHQHMTLNLVVPVGEVRFVFRLTKQKDKFRSETIGAERYARLTVPPGIWFGFQGLASFPSLLVNVANMEHDPNEVLSNYKFEFPLDWNVK